MSGSKTCDQIDRSEQDRTYEDKKRLCGVQVTQGTVDEGIHAMAQKKLRLDAAVLDGITSTGAGEAGGKGGKASETLAMGELLQVPSCPLISLAQRQFMKSRHFRPWP